MRRATRSPVRSAPRRPRLRFEDVRKFGGFQDSWAQPLMPDPKLGRVEYPIGYRHMVSAPQAARARREHVPVSVSPLVRV